MRVCALHFVSTTAICVDNITYLNAGPRLYQPTTNHGTVDTRVRVQTHNRNDVDYDECNSMCVYSVNCYAIDFSGGAICAGMILNCGKIGRCVCVCVRFGM